MLSRVASITLLVFIALVAYAAPKGKETIQVQVVSSRTKTHGSPPGEVFEYTDVMFTLVDGKRVVYECDQRGDVCPVLDSGKMYPAERVGNEVYFSMSSPKGKPFLVKYKEVGGW
jgi:hypothetical protein